MKVDAVKERPRRAGIYSKALRRVFRNRMSIVGTLIFFSLILIAIFAPALAPHPPRKQYWGEEWAPPSSRFRLGTDDLGRDVLSRVIWGARTSLLVGLISVSLMMLIGVTLGAIAGFMGGFVDMILMRVTDIIMVIPSLILLLFISSVLHTRSLFLIITIIGLLGWPGMARLVRSQFLSYKEQNFVEAAKSIGTPDRKLIYKHILPNTVSPMIVSAMGRVAGSILTEASLSFLGFGDPTVISWGLILHQGQVTMRMAPLIAFAPGFAIFITVVGLNLLGDGLRDAFDVKM